MASINWEELEARTVALNEWLYAEGAGLEPPPELGDRLAAGLAALYEELLSRGQPAGRSYLVEGWVEARRVAAENALTAEMDRLLCEPALQCSQGPLTWRSWKFFEREAPDAAALAAGYDALVARSQALVPALERYLSRLRADFGRFGLTPVATFAEREGLTVDALRALLVEVGHSSRSAFAAALADLSQVEFGRPAGPAELRALYLNRMYQPNDHLFGAEGAVAHSLAAFRRLGFDLSRVPIDVEHRPRKYPGAFCFPVRTPGDVRVSVRIATSHHLYDMLYHELGHAVHFAGINPRASFLDRHWIPSGTHETFSTLFETLLAEPEYLQEQFGFDSRAVDSLVAFARFKDGLTAAWLGASALTALDTWVESLSWPQIEQRYARCVEDFSGVAVPPGFARLESFTAGASIYPAGYILANVRVAHWRRHLRSLGGSVWWRSPAAQDDIRHRVAVGGVGMFPKEWDKPDLFLRAFAGSP